MVAILIWLLRLWASWAADGRISADHPDHGDFLRAADSAGAKAAEEEAQMLAALKNGDKVVTTGGVYGTIVGIEDEPIQLRIADQVKVKVLRSRGRRDCSRKVKKVNAPKLYGNSPLSCTGSA